jgi:hypothetical protein
MLGHKWADRWADYTDRRTLTVVASSGHLPDDVRQLVLREGDTAAWLAASVDPNAEDDFWTGFAHGARFWFLEYGGLT